MRFRGRITLACRRQGMIEKQEWLELERFRIYGRNRNSKYCKSRPTRDPPLQRSSVVHRKVWNKHLRLLSRGVLGRSIFSPPLLSRRLTKPRAVCLPLRGHRDLGQRRGFGALHHSDHLSLLVGAVRFRFGSRFLRTERLSRANRSIVTIIRSCVSPISAPFSVRSMFSADFASRGV